MTRGKVKWFSPERGYGFIQSESDQEVFVHHSEILGDGFRLLNEGEEVEFELHDTMRGYHAKNVRRVSKREGVA
jgi:cold shock protein